MEAPMLRLLIPVIHHDGALQAARHAAFLFAERCVSDVELVEVLEAPAWARASAFHSRGPLALYEKRGVLSALTQTRAILDDAGVPYRATQAFGPIAETIAARAAEKQADAVIVDASQLGFLTRWWIISRLLRLTRTPVTMLH
jgi:nucleotide-binding universal stress UspA family protein